MLVSSTFLRAAILVCVSFSLQGQSTDHLSRDEREGNIRFRPDFHLQRQSRAAKGI